MFEKGTYLIDSTASDTSNGTYHSLYFKGLNDITLEGNGATLMINDPYMDVFYFERCKSVTIKGFNIDYSTDPWVQGEVSAVDKTNNTFTLKVNNLNSEKKCVLDDARWSTLTANFGMVRDDDNPLLFKQEMANYFFGCNNVARTSANGDLYKFTLSEDTGKDTIDLLQKGKIAVGSKIIINARIASVGAFRFLYCDGDIKVKDSNVYATNGTAFCVGAVNGNVTVDNVDVLLTKNRWTTSNADGIYSSNICGALKIKNCTWEGLSDDCINLYPQGAAITQVISNNTIKVKGEFLPKVGDSITVLDPINGNVRGDAKVTAVSYDQQYEIWDNKNIAVLTLDKAVSGITPCDINYDTTKYIDLRLTGDIIINHKVQSPGTEIINNTFRYGRDKGVKINVRDFKIMNNTFEYLSGSAVRLHNIPWYVESGGSANGIISNNTITNCSYLSHGNSVYNSPISLYGMAMDNTTDTADMIHSNITISNNTITSVKQVGIFVSSAKDVKILDNTIIGLDTDGTKVKAGIYLKNSDNVEVSGNTITVPSSYLSAGIVKESSATNITIGTNTYNLATGKPATTTN